MVTAAATRAAAAKIIASFTRFGRSRQAEVIEILPTRLAREFPEHTPEEIAKLVREEARREVVFRRKQRERLQRDLPKALQNLDPGQRVQEVQGILDRERRYLGQREEALAERAYTAMEMLDLRRTSPQGAFWRLSDGVQTHTPGCIAMGNKFWPWSVLRVIHPQLHPGCACHLFGLDDAVERGYMTASQVPDPADAKRRADKIIQRVKDIYETATQEEIETYLLELAEVEWEERLAPAQRTGRWRLKPPEQAGEWGTLIEATLGVSAEALDISKIQAHLSQPVTGSPREDFAVHRVLPALIRDRWPKLAAELEQASPRWGQRAVTEATTEFEEWTLEEALGGSVARRAVYGAKPGERFGRGHTKGGQFKPRRGAVAGRPTIRGVARKALRRAIPDLPKMPRQAKLDRDGEWVWLRGRYMFIPEHREFKRKIDGIDWSSPAGSGNIYRNGYLVHVPGEKLPHHNDLDHPVAADIRNIPSTAPWQEAIGEERADEIEDALQANYNREREDSDLAVKNALDVQSLQVKPVGPGEITSVVLDTLQANDFYVTEVRSVERDDIERGAAAFAVLRHPSGAEVAVTSDGGKVLGAIWTPAVEADEPPDLGDTPPESWDDFLTDMRAVAHEVAADVGRTIPQLRRIDIGTAEQDYADHTGSWNHNGDVVLGENVPDGIEMIAQARREGRPLTSYEAGEAYLSYATGIHEMMHAAHGISRYDYQRPALMGMEEALNEEYSRIVTGKVLKRLNLPEALQFQRDRPDDARARGAYLYFRTALDSILNEAKVAPEEREDYIRHLRFDVPPSQRARVIGERIAQVADDGVLATGGSSRYPELQGDPGEAELWVLEEMNNAAEVKSPIGFEPILHVPLGDDVPFKEPHMIDGKPVTVGAHVEVESASLVEIGKRAGGTRYSGRIIAIHDLDAEAEAEIGAPFMLDILTDAADDQPRGRLSNLLPREVTSVEAVDETAELADGTVIREGDFVRYNNRADGGMSTAVVEQIARSSQSGPLPGLMRDSWVIHGRTTQDSLNPDQEIILTLERTGRRVERVALEVPEVPVAATEGVRAPFASRIPALERQRTAQALGLTPLESIERRVRLANEISSERVRLAADSDALRKGDRIQIRGLFPGEDREGVVAKTNKASLDVEELRADGTTFLRRYHKHNRNDDGSWNSAIATTVNKPVRTEGVVDTVSIPRGLFNELWALEYDTAPGEGTDHDDLADELARARDRTPRTARSVEIELTPTRARYLDKALDYHDDIWAEAAQGYDAGDRARGNSYRRSARKLRERLASVKTEGITDPAQEVADMHAGEHRRVFFATDPERAAEKGWTDAEKLQVGREFTDALDDYEEVLQRPEYQRVLRWSGDEGLAGIAESEYLTLGVKKVSVNLLADDNEEKDGWGVTSTGGNSARVDTRRPGIRTADASSGVPGMEWAADPRQTAIHEAHHMHGSNSEFDVGSEVAFAYHVNKRALTGPGPDSIKPEVVSTLLHRGGVNSRLGRSIRALLGDDLLDRWAQDAGWPDIFNRRPQPVEDGSIEGRVATLNEYRDEFGYSVLQQIDWLERKNLVDVSGQTGYDTRLEPGERAYMRPNGETLVLGTDGRARVLDSMADYRVETPGITQRNVLPLGRVDDQPQEVGMDDENTQFTAVRSEGIEARREVDSRAGVGASQGA